MKQNYKTAIKEAFVTRDIYLANQLIHENYLYNNNLHHCENYDQGSLTNKIHGFTNEKLMNKIYSNHHRRYSKDNLSIPTTTHRIWIFGETKKQPIAGDLYVSLASVYKLNHNDHTWRHILWTNDKSAFSKETLGILKDSPIEIREIDQIPILLQLNVGLYDVLQEANKISPIVASDLAKLLALYQYGGLIQDLDYQVHDASKFSLLCKNTDFFAAEFDGIMCTNDFLGAYPQHPIINRAIQISSGHIISAPIDLLETCDLNIKVCSYAGPAVIAAAYFNESVKKDSLDLILPPGQFLSLVQSPEVRVYVSSHITIIFETNGHYGSDFLQGNNWLLKSCYYTYAKFIKKIEDTYRSIVNIYNIITHDNKLCDSLTIKSIIDRLSKNPLHSNLEQPYIKKCDSNEFLTDNTISLFKEMKHDIYILDEYTSKFIAMGGIYNRIIKEKSDLIKLFLTHEINTKQLCYDHHLYINDRIEYKVTSSLLQKHTHPESSVPQIIHLIMNSNITKQVEKLFGTDLLVRIWYKDKINVDKISALHTYLTDVESNIISLIRVDSEPVFYTHELNNLLSLYSSRSKGVFESYLSLLVLEKYGGSFIESKAEISQYDAIIQLNKLTTFYACVQSNQFLSYDMVSASPNHKIIQETLEKIHDNIFYTNNLSDYLKYQCDNTNEPHDYSIHLTSSYYNYIGSDIVILPPSACGKTGKYSGVSNKIFETGIEFWIDHNNYYINFPLIHHGLRDMHFFGTSSDVYNSYSKSLRNSVINNLYIKHDLNVGLLQTLSNEYIVELYSSQTLEAENIMIGVLVENAADVVNYFHE